MTKHALIQEIEKNNIKADLPSFKIGDTLKVTFRIIEGDKERLQAFAGVVIARNGSGMNESVSLYRISYGSSMERVFMLHSPRVSSIEVTRLGKVRKSKLYYLRGKTGKKARVPSRIEPKVKK